MSPSAFVLLGAALCAASPSGLDVAVLRDHAPDLDESEVPSADILVPLPPPPGKAELKTRYFGTVTVTHEAHLKRRVHCAQCHGPGRVTHIAFTPKVAHDRCLGCHNEIQKGPTGCRGCHVLPPKEPATMTAAPAPPAAAATPAPVAAEARANYAAAATTADAASATAAEVSGTAAANPTSAALAAAASAHALAGAAHAAAGIAALDEDAQGSAKRAVASTAARPSETFSDSKLEAGGVHRTVQLGAAAGPGYGVSARLVSRQGELVVSHSLERLGGGGPTRTLLLLGSGVRLPVFPLPGLGLFAEGVAGLDAVERPSMDVMPALGARLALEWSPRWALRLPVFVSVTGLVDTFHAGPGSPAFLYATAGVGNALEPP